MKGEKKQLNESTCNNQHIICCVIMGVVETFHK